MGDLAENNFDLMYEQLKELKAGNKIQKPIYNHVNGTLDTPEEITPTQIVIVEGLHPMADPRVRELLDFSLYLDITDDVKFAWKIQRDMVERGHSLESIQQSIEARKPDFDAFVAPQRGDADVVIQVLPTDLIPDENSFDLMYEQLKELKAGNKIQKPIYNHVNGTLDTPEEITPTQIVIVEGLHPMADPRVRELLDFSLYLDITDDV